MPETKAIPDLARHGMARTRDMIAKPPAEKHRKAHPAVPFKEEPRSLEELNAIIANAEPMVSGGTRAVLGEGPIGAALAFVGEQPGDQEDLEGHPFVGPAGQIFNQALAEAGIDRASTYVTNAVKHFKYEPRGKRRLHKTPTAGEVSHYRWWLEKELDFVGPKLVVALGATAALALNKRPVAIMRARGPMDFGSRRGYVTVHPSYLLRLPDPEERQKAYEAFCADLRHIRTIAAM